MTQIVSNAGPSELGLTAIISDGRVINSDTRPGDIIEIIGPDSCALGQAVIVANLVQKLSEIAEIQLDQLLDPDARSHEGLAEVLNATYGHLAGEHIDREVTYSIVDVVNVETCLHTPDDDVVEDVQSAVDHLATDGPSFEEQFGVTEEQSAGVMSAFGEQACDDEEEACSEVAESVEDPEVDEDEIDQQLADLDSN